MKRSNSHSNPIISQNFNQLLYNDKQPNNSEETPLHKFYKNCDELKDVIPYENIKEIANNYIIKQAVLLWYIALKYTDKFINYINDNDIKLINNFYKYFKNDYMYSSEKTNKIFKLINKK